MARIVNGAFRFVSGVTAGYRRRDRVLTREAAAILLGQLAAWLETTFIGYCLLMWPLVHGGIGMALTTAGSSMLTLRFAEPAGPRPSVVVFVAAFTGLVGVAVDSGWLAALVHKRGHVPAAERHPGVDRVQLSGVRPGPAAGDLECVLCRLLRATFRGGRSGHAQVTALIEEIAVGWTLSGRGGDQLLDSGHVLVAVQSGWPNMSSRTVSRRSSTRMPS